MSLAQIGSAMKFLGIQFKLFQMIKRIADAEQATILENDFKQVVKARRRELSKKYHPDKGGDPELMKQINAACDYLMSVKIDYQPRQQQQWMYSFSFSFGYDDASTTTSNRYYYTGS